MKHYFLDTNVVLDFLSRREPFAEAALAVFRAGLEKRAVLYVASLSFANVYYVLRKQTNPQLARSLVAALERLVNVVTVDAAVVQAAIAGPFADFEDGLQHYAAVSLYTVDAIIIRDRHDFASSTLPVLSPAQALLALADSL